MKKIIYLSMMIISFFSCSKKQNDLKLELLTSQIICVQNINKESIRELSADICTNENWKKWLFIDLEHKKYAFKKWENSNILEESIFESVSIFKGDFGTTIIYKSTDFSFKKSSTGNL